MISPTYALTVKPIEKDKPAYFTGFLISDDTELHFRLLDQELTFQKNTNLTLDKINKSYEATTNIMQARIDTQQKHIESLTDRLGRDDSLWGKLGMFLLGAATATVMAYAVTRVTK